MVGWLVASFIRIWAAFWRVFSSRGAGGWFQTGRGAEWIGGHVLDGGVGCDGTKEKKPLFHII